MSSFWAGRRVLVTGHTGFKGAWLTLWLHGQSAVVAGLALEPETEPSLFNQLNLAGKIDHQIGDIRDAQIVARRIAETRPEVIFHLAAQPLVRRSYRHPAETWATNVMGTVNLLDALRDSSALCAVVVVTTDKVYENREWVHAYREDDQLGGHDPYSASKAACELVAASYRNSFFTGGPIKLASARAGNVIGGGDWAEDRIVPDLVRALVAGKELALRNPEAVRPWQHVLDPLAGYMHLAERLWREDIEAASAFNFGPDAADQRSVRALADAALQHLPGRWHDASELDGPHEASKLSLATDKARALLGWTPRLDFDEAVRQTMHWYREVQGGACAREITLAQIRAYETRDTA